MKQLDYSFKAYCLNNYSNLISAIRKAKRFDYALSYYHSTGSITYHLVNGSNESTYQLKDYCFKTNLINEFNECNRLVNSFDCRKSRLRKKVSLLVNSFPCSFLTLTFTNNVLENTSAETRRRYVARYLKSLGCPYIANIDFGDKTDREHYHAIVGCVPNSKTWSYGFSCIEKIRNTDISSTKLSTYITKLTNHAIKETTKRNALLFSRRVSH